MERTSEKLFSQAGSDILPLSTLEFQRLVDDTALRCIAWHIALSDRHEAEDMVQEAYRCAWKSREGYQEGRAIEPGSFPFYVGGSLIVGVKHLSLDLPIKWAR